MSNLNKKYQWREWGNYAIVNFAYVKKEIDKVHRQKGYSISKALSQGVWIYTLWKLPDICLGHFKSADQAKNYLYDYEAENAEK